jgi:hypothetical protein
MRIEYYHASVYGNGAKVAEEFRNSMTDKGIIANVHHVDDVVPEKLPSADVHLFSSPGRMGKPIKGMRRFMEKLVLPPGTRYAILTTEAPPKPDRTGKMPSEEETCRWQRVRPIMNEILQGKNMVKIAEDKIYVIDNKGPMEEGWQMKVKDIADRIASLKAEGAME